MSNIGSINANRCSRNSGIPKLCLTESTLSTTTRTTTTWTIGESPSTVSYNNRGRVSTTAAVIDESRTTTFEEESSTTGPIVPPLPGSTGIPTANPVKSKDDGITIVVIAVGAGVLLVVFLIGSLLMCRYVPRSFSLLDSQGISLGTLGVFEYVPALNSCGLNCMLGAGRNKVESFELPWIGNTVHCNGILLVLHCLSTLTSWKSISRLCLDLHLTVL